MPDTPDLIMELNDFANHCGYFFNACMQDGIIANNGYNCSHPDQDETLGAAIAGAARSGIRRTPKTSLTAAF